MYEEYTPSEGTPTAAEATDALSAAGRRRSPGIAFFVLHGLYLLVLLTLTIINAGGAERWWLSALNLYLPQWLWGVPGILLLLGTLWRVPRWSWLPALCLLWVIGPIMGCRWAWATSTEPPAGSARLRLLTYNVKNARGDMNAILREIEDAKPDLVFFQETGHILETPVAQAFQGWNVVVQGEYLIATRLPLSEAALRPLLSDTEKRSCFRAKVLVGNTPVTLYDVHLVTPRRGLTALRSRDDVGVERFEVNTSARLQQAEMLEGYLKSEKGALIVAGDLNAPEASVVCQRLFGLGLHDAFSLAGRGFGYSYGHALKLRHSYLRIDHILVSPECTVGNCRTGNAEGAEHRPVIADLFVPNTP